MGAEVKKVRMEMGVVWWLGCGDGVVGVEEVVLLVVV